MMTGTAEQDLCSKCWLSEMEALIRICDTPLENILNSIIGGKFIARKGSISTQRARTSLRPVRNSLDVVKLASVN